MKAVIYRRLSVLRDDDPTLSPNTQEAAARAYCDQQGWTVVAVVDDMDESGSAKGKRLERPGLVRAIDLVHSGTAEVIVASRLDRLARNTADGLELSNKVKIATPQLGLLGGSAAGDFTRTLMLALAEMESTQISERVAAGVATARQAGRWTSARVPYGYNAVKGADGGTYLQVNKHEQQVVRRIVKRLLNGDNMNTVVRWLNAEQIPTKMGGIWRWSTVNSIVTSPLTLRGYSHHRGELIRDTGGEPLVIAEPLIEPADAAAMEARSADAARGRGQRRGRGPSHWASGLARCGTCGAPMHIHRHTSGRERSRVVDLVCSAPAGSCSKRRTIRLAKFEDLVTGQFLESFGGFEFTRQTVTDTSEQVATEKAKWNAVISDITRKMVAPGADVMALAGELEQAKAALENVATAGTRVEVEGTGQTVSEVWDTLTDQDRATVLTEALEVVIVGSDPRVDLVYREGDEDYDRD